MLGSIFGGSGGGTRITGGGGGGVTSFNTRTGSVVPQAGDYSADEIQETTRLFVSSGQVSSWDGKQDSLPNATSFVSGILTNTDWSTFNAKQSALNVTQTPTQLSTPLRFSAGTNTPSTAAASFQQDGANPVMELKDSTGVVRLSIIGGSLGALNAVGMSANFGGEVNAISYLGIKNKSYIGSGIDGDIQMFNNTLTSFRILNFGPRTASFPALKVVGSRLRAILGNDSASTIFEAAGFAVNGVDGKSGTFTSADGKIITVNGGAITDIS